MDDEEQFEENSLDPGLDDPELLAESEILGIGGRAYPPIFDYGSEELEASIPPAPMLDDPGIVARIAELEARLDGLMSQSLAERDSLSPPRPETLAPPEEIYDSAREFLDSDYYRTRWGKAALRAQEQGVDDFGLDPTHEEKLKPWLEFLFRYYFRIKVEGIEKVPSEGSAVLVANHSGALPLDGLMLRQALRLRHPASRDMRWLAEDYVFYLPFIGVTMNRLGAVRACQENAQRLLRKDHLVAVFPEGAEGIKKLYRDRYQLQRFGRGGYVRLCLKTGSPLIPVAIVGAEETNPILYRLDDLSKVIGLDYLPITPTFPLMGPLGLLPAPTRWRIVFGDPIDVSEYGPSAADDHVLVGRLSEQVQTSIEELLKTTLAARKSVWF